MVPFGIFTVDTTLAVRTWHAWLAEVTRIAAGDALNRSLVELVPDLGERGLLAVFERVLAGGTVEVLAPALHQFLIPCPPSAPSATFERMQQRVTVGPLREDGRIVGAVVTIEDVTARVERQRALARALANGDVEERRRAARSLGGSRSAEAVAPLTRALGDADVSVRRAAVAGLAAHGADIVHTLVETIREQHGNFSVLSSVLDLLATSDIDIVEPMIACLADEDPNLRIQAALILGERRDRRATPALIAALSDADVNVQFHAIEALGRLEAPEAVEPLLEIAERRDFFLSFPAIQTLARLGDASVAPRLVPLLTDELLRAPAVEALGELADETVVPALAELLNRPGAPTEVLADALTGLHERHQRRYGAGEHIAELTRRTITASGVQNLLDAVGRVSGERLRGLAGVLGWMDGPAVQRALTRLLGQAAVRGQVVEALVRYGARVVDLLVDQLQAEDLETRHAAAVALGRIGERRATAALVAALDDPELAMPAAAALARIGAPEAFAPLLGLIGNPDSAIRQAAIAALNSIGHPDMPARIRERLGHDDELVRESAVKIAGYFGYRECVDDVLARCSDPSERVRRATVDHLPFFDDPRVTPSIVTMLEHDTPAVRAGAAAALARVEEAAAVPALTRALRDPEPWVRYFALRSLGTWRNPAVAPLVLDRLERDDAGQVRLAAIETLGRVDAPHSLRALAPLTGAADPDVARAAISAIGQSASDEAATLLEALLRAAEPWRRMAAVAAIAVHGGGSAAAALQWVAAADEDADVATAAIEALARLAGAPDGEAARPVRALLTLLAEPRRREQVLAALASLPRRHTPLVAEGLRHASAEVRRSTVEALARMKDAEASRALAAALEDEDASVRATAVTELRRLGSRSAERRLMTMARMDPDQSVRQAAVLAVARTQR